MGVGVTGEHFVADEVLDERQGAAGSGVVGVGHPTRAIWTRQDLVVADDALAVGAALAAIFGLLVIWLNTNQFATGLALTLFGTGFSAFVGTSFVQAKIPDRVGYAIPGLSDIPLIGPALFRHHPMVYLTVALALLLIWFMYRTRSGLVMRSVGESPESAHALGYPVRRIRLGAVVVGGALCGLAGAYISVIYTPLWVEGMVAGKGWIALALTMEYW